MTPPGNTHPLTPAQEKLAILALSMGAFVMALNANVIAALLPFLGEFSMTRAEQGMLVGSAGVAGALGSLLLGPVVDRVGRRPPMVWGTALFVLASLGHLFADSLAMLIAVRSVAGFAGGVVFTSASSCVADIVPFERRGKAMGTFSAGMFLGLPAGLPLAQVMASLDWWRGIFLLQTVVGIFSLLMYFRALPKNIGRGERLTAGIPRLFRPEILASLFSVLLYVGGFFTCVQFAGAWLDRAGIVSREHQWLVWLVLGLCSAAGALGLTRFSDRVGKQPFTAVTSSVVAVCVLCLVFVDGLFPLLLVGIPLAVVSASRTGAFQALMSEMVPQDLRGTLMGIRATFVNVGTGVFPFLAGRVAETTDSGFEAIAYLGSGAIALSALLVLFFVKRR